MNNHVKYSSEKIADSEDLEWYEKDIEIPSTDDFELYSEQTEKALDNLSEGFGITISDVQFVYGNWSEERASELVENRKTSYTSGYSFHPSFHSWESEPTIYLKSFTSYDGWKDGFRNAVVHEVAHQLFYAGEFSGFEDQVDSIVFEGHAMVLAKKVCELFGYDYSSPWRPSNTIDVEYDSIIEELPKQRTLSDENSENIGNLFRGGEPFPNQEEYIISYQFGEWITNNTDYQIQDFPNFSREEREELVKDALESLYN